MRIKEAIYEDCSFCGARKHPPVQKEEFGCDGCGISMSKFYERQKIQNEYHEYLEITIFPNDHSDEKTDRKEFCSWKCCVGYLKKLKYQDFNFVSLPYLTSKQSRKGLKISDFLRMLKD